MPTILSEREVGTLLTIEDALDAVESAFEGLGTGENTNQPRRRVNSPGSRLQLMGAACPGVDGTGAKVYNTSGGETRFLVAVFDESTGGLRGLLEADTLGRLRTGAASGVATDYLAREDATSLGLIGTGSQAGDQVRAVASVRDIEVVRAYSSTLEHRESFAAEMDEELDATVEAVDSAAETVGDADIVTTITSSTESVFDDEDIGDGVHINAVGSNSLVRQEIPTRTVVGADRLVVDSLDQAKLEAGDLTTALELGYVTWEGIHELGDVVAGHAPGRRDDSEVTLFESLGLAAQDVSLAVRALEYAESEHVGLDVSMFG
jgi:ornithine cyclodeaminase/alanine dehydrogenase-like protein (mu-crystallin family)